MKELVINAPWRSRPETPEQIALRIKSLLALLRPITPLFQRSFFRISENNILEIDDGENWLVGAIAADVCKDDLGAPAPALGYLSVINNMTAENPRQTESVFLHASVGSTFIDNVALLDSHQLDWHPDLLAYRVVR